MTTTINEYATGFRDAGHKIDVISIFGCSEYRKVKPSLVKKTDRLLKQKPILTLIAYWTNKLILLFQIYWQFIFKRYDAILAMDFSAVNITFPLKKIFKIPLLQIYFGGTSELIDQQKLNQKSLITNYFFNQEKKSFKKSDYLITSDFFLPNIKRSAEKTPPIFFIRSAVNPDKFFADENNRNNFRKELKISLKKFVLLFAGRLEPRKGVRYPALAAKELLDQGFENFLLLYAGKGQEVRWLQDFIKKNNLESHIKILDSVPHEKMPDLYRAADCFLFTSIPKEGITELIAISPLEAMASEVPVISFKVENIPEADRILIDKKNALLTPMKNHHALAKAILEIYNNQKLKNRITKQGRQFLFDQKWTIQDIIKNLLSIINKIQLANNKIKNEKT